MPILTYPTKYPCPRFDPYSWTVDMGVLRTPMDGGYARQRRLYDVMPHGFTIEFMIPLALLNEWQSWVNDHAYDYFALPLYSFASSPDVSTATMHVARFTTNLEMALLDKTMVQVRVQAERAPAAVVLPPSFAGDWYIARDPANPATDFVDPGTPAAPSIDIIVAQLP